MSEKEKILVSVTQGLSRQKKMNLHITVALLSFMSMVFHFTSVFFFTLQLESLFLVGIFLGLGNLFAFLLDVPIGILQYYFKPKQLYAFGVVSQMIAMLIFSMFIFSVTDFLLGSAVGSTGALESVLSFFVFDVGNIILLIIAAFCYGFTKEVNDITTISYVLSNAHPSQYKQIIAKNNIFFGAGSFIGLFVAGVILTFSPKLIIGHILFLIGFVFFILYKFFDNEEQVFDPKAVKNFRLEKVGVNLKQTKDNLGGFVSSTNVKSVLQGSKYVILLPRQVISESPSFHELKTKTLASFKDISQILRFAMNSHLIVYWSFIMLLTFGFWDTFASTFLIDFLDEVQPGWSFVLLGFIAIPAFGLQSYFGKLSDKVGGFKISLVGLFLSSASLIIMAFFVSSLNLYIILTLALTNSVGYSICMSISVATFLESYNVAYANRKSLKQIDANASAAPMKILQNLANVIGLFLGGLILGFAGFAGFFFVFGLFIGVFMIWSFFMKSYIDTQA